MGTEFARSHGRTRPCAPRPAAQDDVAPQHRREGICTSVGRESERSPRAVIGPGAPRHLRVDRLGARDVSAPPLTPRKSSAPWPPRRLAHGACSQCGRATPSESVESNRVLTPPAQYHRSNVELEIGGPAVTASPCAAPRPRSVRPRPWHPAAHHPIAARR